MALADRINLLRQPAPHVFDMNDAAPQVVH
jgi:hypothetical protein